jgi:hypothetical protein
MCIVYTIHELLTVFEGSTQDSVVRPSLVYGRKCYWSLGMLRVYHVEHLI